MEFGETLVAIGTGFLSLVLLSLIYVCTRLANKLWTDLQNGQKRPADNPGQVAEIIREELRKARDADRKMIERATAEIPTGAPGGGATQEAIPDDVLKEWQAQTGRGG